MMHIRNTIVADIRDIKHIPDLTIADDADLLGAAGFDSLEVIEFIARLERRFGLAFGGGADDYAALRSLDSLTAWVHARV